MPVNEDPLEAPPFNPFAGAYTPPSGSGNVMGMRSYVPTYCSPQGVFDALMLLSPNATGITQISDVTTPNLDQVAKRIVQMEATVDAATGSSWKENKVKDEILNKSVWWKQEPYGVSYPTQRYGGQAVQLNRPIRRWNPELGDKLEVRSSVNSWTEITEYNVEDEETGADKYDKRASFWFDYKAGVLNMTRSTRYEFSAVRISYRWGHELEEIPYNVERLTELMAAKSFAEVDYYRMKIGGGQDLSNTYTRIGETWQKEIDMLITLLKGKADVVVESMYM